MMLRFGGIASGLDTEQIVRDLMQAERQPVDRLFQRKVAAEWKRDEYRSVNTKLSRMRNASFDMRLQGTFLQRKLSSSNEAAVNGAITGESQLGSYQIGVESLATGATRISPGFSQDVDVEANFADFVERAFNQETSPFKDEGKFIFHMRSTTNGEWSEITVTAESSFDDVISQINTNKELGINAFHDEVSGKVVFTTEGTGEEALVDFGAHPDYNETGLNFLHEVFRKKADGTYGWFDNSGNQGSNAVININGLTTERSSNTFDLNGTTITINEVTDTPVRIDVQQDTEGILNKVKDFVELYNEIISDIQGKIYEPRHRDFPPLTDQQREDMSEREVELWEEKAKSGMLRRDQKLSNILGNMRMALTSAVSGSGEFSSLHQIGITTEAWHEQGKLHLDENKLRQAITEDSNAVNQLFTQQADEESGQSPGIARKLYDVIDQGIGLITDTAGREASSYDQSYLGEEIRRYEERLVTMEERLAQTENRYWKQFTAMERALNEMNSQSDWLYQQLTAMQG